MNQVGKLIQSKVIPFVENFIKHYQEIGLNEVDAVIICKLYYLLDEGTTILDINHLVDDVTLSIDELTKHIMSLVDNNYLEIIVENGKEEFNLNGTFDKLGKALDVDKKQMEQSKNAELIKMSTMYVETTFGRSATTADLIQINSWVSDGFSYEQIKEAVLETAKNKKNSLLYANAILRSKQQRREVNDDEVDLELRDLLKDLMNK